MDFSFFFLPHKKNKEEKSPFFAVIWDGSPHAPWMANDKDKKDFQNLNEKSQNHYLVFNENPLGYYPLVYQNGARQQIAEIEIFDVIKNYGVMLNTNQSKWFSVDKLPF